MRIDSYSFGEMVIDGKRFSADLIIYPERIDPSWWREEGHRLRVEDLAKVLAASPEVLIIGTGYSGVLQVPDDVRKELLKRNMELHIEKSGRAVEIFNSLNTKRRTIAAFHLTC